MSRGCRATQDGQVMVKGSDKTWSLEKEMENLFSIPAFRKPLAGCDGKIYYRERRTSKGGRCLVCYRRSVEKKLQKENSGSMKAWNQRKKQHPVADMTGDGMKFYAIKSNAAIQPSNPTAGHTHQRNQN